MFEGFLYSGEVSGEYLTTFLIVDSIRYGVWNRTYETADGERHVKIRRTSPLIKNSAAEDGEGPDWDELSAKEDEMMLREFERRMSFNKKQVRRECQHAHASAYI